ncbi:MAG TPA: replication protein RepA [archaeon]|nr:replication protein RepA [archaeon]
MPDRRLPAIERKISEIQQQDIRVRLLGTVIDKQENSFVLDDSTGQVKVSTQSTHEENKIIRVIGKVIALESGFEIQAEIIQDMGGLDLDLFKRVEAV